MIRRRVGNQFWLITQDDHAKLSGALAAHVGNDAFARMSPFGSAVKGVALHDAGWPLHDDAPTLNDKHWPIDVFETTRPLGLKVWSASAERAAKVDPYAGLLVSLHSFSLSMMAVSNAPASGAGEHFTLDEPRARFEINRFQHGQIELQERLRKKVGLSTDIPLRAGLAETTDDPRELELAFNFRMLQALDKLSLNICCTKPPNESISPVQPRPGSTLITMLAKRPNPHELRVSPWPFDAEKVEVDVPYKSVPAHVWTDESTFRDAYATAEVQTLRCTLRSAR